MSTDQQDARLIPWEGFQSAFVAPGIPADVPVEGDPHAVLFTDNHGTRLGLRIEVPAVDLEDLPLPRTVRIDARPDDVAIWIDDPQMFAPFYAFLLDVANRLQVEGASVRDGLSAALTAWRQMIAAPRLMGHDTQIGLLGELWILERLLTENGTTMFKAWTAPTRQVHDFRLGGSEIEVKTTSGRERRHVISSLEQLLSSPEMDLFVVSIQVESAGLAEGWTLGNQIDRVRALLGEDATASSILSNHLEELGWDDADTAHYPLRVRLRSAPTLIRVDQDFPRIAEADLVSQLGGRMDRISDLVYRIDVSGLGHAYPAPEFLAVLPLGNGE